MVEGGAEEEAEAVLVEEAEEEEEAALAEAVVVSVIPVEVSRSFQGRQSGSRSGSSGRGSKSFSDRKSSGSFGSRQFGGGSSGSVRHAGGRFPFIPWSSIRQPHRWI